ncbi:hypothetical protein AD428_07385 [Achromobacter sp. DMS1]|nr:hypothetical protein AD428_07385 [Achromobacter sp. DMS1]
MASAGPDARRPFAPRSTACSRTRGNSGCRPAIHARMAPTWAGASSTPQSSISRMLLASYSV